MYKSLVLGAGLALILTACSGEKPRSVTDTPVVDTQIVTLETGGDFATNLQAALISAKVGSTVQLPAGHFQFQDGLSLDVAGVTLKGMGQDKTILDFGTQKGAGEGLLVTSENVTLSGFTIRDTAGDGIKSKGADGITYRDLTVEWTGEPDQDNGAYGVYPVSSKNILIDGVTVRGASDAGIYVGQSQNIIVRNSLAEYNVAGIEIENSSNADVYDNRAQHNAGGILIFDLPDLPIIGGHDTRVFHNEITNNNTRNFAPAGNIVATVPSGTGVIIMANENVHVFDNHFVNNRTVSVVVGAYQDGFSDKNYNPLPRNIVVRDNKYEGGGDDPQGLMAMFAPALGGKLPPVIWDGVTSWADNEAIDVNLSVKEADDVGYVSLGLGSYPIVEANVRPSPFRPKGTPKAEPAGVTLAHDK
jgi:parallel beta-helix repeat protein